MVVLRYCVWLLAEMPSFRAVFGLNNRKSGVNRHLRFCPFPKNWENVPCVGAYYSFHHGTFPSFLEMDKTAGAYSLQIYDYLSQIQSETKAFLLIVRHNNEGPPISDWQWRHRRHFFIVGSQNRVNLVLFFKPWFRGFVLLVLVYVLQCGALLPIHSLNYWTV